MARYKMLPGDTSGVFDTLYGVGIPQDPGFLAWRQYLDWLAQGNTPDPAFTQSELDAQASMLAKQGQISAALANGLPSWNAVSNAVNAIGTLADAKAFLLRLANVVYVHIKNDIN